jgi:hypothetical protein
MTMLAIADPVFSAKAPKRSAETMRRTDKWPLTSLNVRNDKWPVD